MHVWVNLLELPRKLWTLDIFCTIGNKLGEYFEANMSFKTTRLRKVARILVKFDPCEDKFEYINLHSEILVICNKLTMRNFPFIVDVVITRDIWCKTTH